MSSRTCAARRAIAALGTVVAVALAMACGDESEVGPAGPSVVDAPPTTSTSTSAGGLVNAAGGSSVEHDASSAGVNDLDLSRREGVVRNARSDATIAKPIVVEVARLSGDSELAIRWAVSSKTDIADYRIQWSPGCMTSWSRKIGGESIFHTSSGGTDELTAIRPAGGNLRHRAFKVRVRARMAANTVTHRKGGPWSEPTILYPQNPTDANAQEDLICTVAYKATGSFSCYANIDGELAVLEIDSNLDFELEPGGGEASLTITHASAAATGASIGLGGFRAEARTSPDAWQIVSLDHEWRDYC